ncbi:hypothetical protein T484DRAFT_1771378 [Baffinella frigidus]|nr:hypothetical protein T484DRAFT_1771378 [Cryptophyta sp. CCMP2293]
MQPVDKDMLSNRRMAGRHDFEDPAKKEGRGSGGGHWRDLRGDYSNIAILLLLYTLQGVPMGLGASIPLLLQERGASFAAQSVFSLERGASFAAQSVFSLVSWPFSLKLLAAPSMKGTVRQQEQAASFTAQSVFSLVSWERGASFAAQSVFSLVSWPFSLKLLWAPIVDACFSERFGRRKSWLIPIQLLCAAVMLCFADKFEWFRDSAGMTLHSMDYKDTFEGYLGDGSSPPQVLPLSIGFFCLYLLMATQVSLSLSRARTRKVLPLSIGFFCLYLLMATQDIAVDGWALTMLAKRNAPNH